jgi:hypothetical protein
MPVRRVIDTGLAPVHIYTGDIAVATIFEQALTVKGVNPDPLLG